MNNSASEEDSRSYRQIIKSASIIGGSQFISIILRIIRTKVLALILGPAGFGVISMYDSITSLGGTVAVMGLDTSGVRQIAEANGSGDQERIARTIKTLRRTALFSGLLGMFLLLLLSKQVSLLTFGNSEHALDLAVLSITVFFYAVTGGQTALIQGMRRIRDLAMLSIMGAFWGTIFSIPIVYIFGRQGIVVYMIIVSAMSIVTSWWYSRKIKVPAMHMSVREIIDEAKPLLRIGLVFMLTTLIGFGSLYAIRVMIVRYLGLSEAGMFQAATTLSALYVGFIIDAMGRDYYPRLTALSNDQAAFNSLVNKQLEVGLLIGIPGVMATMSLSQIVIEIFYSAKFLPAYDVLRWQLLGDVLRIITYPLGFILIAKGNTRTFLWTEVLTKIIHLAMIWFGIQYFGLTGTGMAFFGYIVCYGFLIYLVVHTYYKVTFSPQSIRIGIIASAFSAIVFLTPYFLSSTVSLLVNLGVTLLGSIYSLRTLYSILGPEAISSIISKIKSRLVSKKE